MLELEKTKKCIINTPRSVNKILQILFSKMHFKEAEVHAENYLYQGFFIKYSISDLISFSLIKSTFISSVKNYDFFYFISVSLT